jgi:hypothetical protein
MGMYTKDAQVKWVIYKKHNARKSLFINQFNYFPKLSCEGSKITPFDELSFENSFLGTI